MAIYSRRPRKYVGQNLNAKWAVVSETADTIPVPVLTAYPIADSSKIGKTFIYRGTEWKYFSKEELINMSLEGFPPGFPVPVSDVPDLNRLINVVEKGTLNIQSFQVFTNSGLGGNRINVAYQQTSTLPQGAGTIEIDFLFVRQLFNSNFSWLVKSAYLYISGSSDWQPVTLTLTKIRNAELLNELQDGGTAKCFTITSSSGFQFNISAEVLNDFFKQLPKTAKTATLDVRGASGAATCTPSIATAKGYTVITT